MKNQGSPYLRAFARALLDHEASLSPPGTGEFDKAGSVCVKLRAPICALAGPIGFRALLSRALAVASTEVPTLKMVKITPEGSLEGSPETGPTHDSESAAKAGLALLVSLLGLLATFIGPTLTQRLLSDIWPDIPKLDEIPKGPEP